MAWITLGISCFHVVAPSSSAWSFDVVSSYGVYGSPTVCHRREPVVSRILGHNQ
jgi:hypothetical protein